LPQWLRFYVGNGGEMTKLTVSSDASITSPKNLFEQITLCVLRHGFALERVLPLVTSNTANALKLGRKGVLAAGKSADVLVLDKETLRLCEVVSSGRRLFRDGKLNFKEAFLRESSRSIKLKGDKS
jgi:beta-aspartyl-dipeptidase (metallo-type)